VEAVQNRSNNRTKLAVSIPIFECEIFQVRLTSISQICGLKVEECMLVWRSGYDNEAEWLLKLRTGNRKRLCRISLIDEITAAFQ
jgi:hypothetical protein